MSVRQFSPLIRVPPFPGASRKPIATPVDAGSQRASDAECDALVDLINRYRVGGTYWGMQPTLQQSGYVLVRVQDENARKTVIENVAADTSILSWTDSPNGSGTMGRWVSLVTGCCDPWRLVADATQVFTDADDELAMIAAISGVPMHCVGQGRFSHLSVDRPSHEPLRDAVRTHVLNGIAYSDPFTGEEIGATQAVELCGFWRQLIDSNRDISAAVGFAAWKRETVEPLLWSGAGMSPFRAQASGLTNESNVAVWRARVAARELEKLKRSRARLIEVEDGFIRSVGLGADCVPPLSIVVDRVGAHFDPSHPSDLEELLQAGEFPEELLQRARSLRRLIVESGISKYGEVGQQRLGRQADNRHYVLVPGQVEDDRAVVLGGQGLTSNLELLRRARVDAPDAYILYKPHPDVEAGHRKGAVPVEECLSLADEIVGKQPISPLIDLVDEVHVNTSLAGFEALLRGKSVTTHGVPFYAGWGLTRDLGRVPQRRTARRSLDEMVAATLLLYPRYLDPLTGLPCPPEVLVRRLSEGSEYQGPSALIGLRRLQGRLRRQFAAVTQWVSR